MIPSKRSVLSEALVASICLAILGTFLRPLLQGNATLPHDNFNNYFPAFYYFVSNLWNGVFPLWNPYTHGGEPFYPLILQERLLEPLTLINIFLGKLFINDLVVLHNVNRIVASLFLVLGIYLLMRKLFSNLWIRLCLIPVLLFSSIFFGSFQQEGILHQFAWTPFILILWYDLIFEKRDSWARILALGVLVGVNFQSYLFAGTLCLITTLVAVTYLKYRPNWLALAERAHLPLKLGMAVVVAVLMTLPNLVVFLERDLYVYPMRMRNPEIMKEHKFPGPMQTEGTPADIYPAFKPSYEILKQTGTNTTAWDLLHAFVPNGNVAVHGAEHAWGHPSEAYLYLGILPAIVALMGIIYSSHPLKPLFSTILSLFGLLSLGYLGGLHRLIYPLFPPLWPLRNVHCLILFIETALVFFFACGLEWLLSVIAKKQLLHSVVPQTKREYALTLMVAALWCLGVLFATSLTFPNDNWAFLGILLPLFTTAFIFKPRSRRSTLWGVLLGIFVTIGSLTRFPSEFILRTLTPGFITLLLFMALYFAQLSNGDRTRRLAIRTIKSMILLFIGWDLILALPFVTHLYEGQLHPRNYLNFSGKPGAFTFPSTRTTHDYYPRISLRSDNALSGQVPRYLGLLSNKASALSALFQYKTKFESLSFPEALRAKRWNSFFLSKRYFSLLHSGWSDTDFIHSFAIDRPTVGFYSADCGIFDSSADALDFRNCPQVNAPFTVSDFGPNHLEAHLTTANPTWLFWSDGFHPRWQANLDGKPHRIDAANINFKAVKIAPGTHTLRFAFRHPAFLSAVAVFWGLFFLPLVIYSVVAIRTQIDTITKPKRVRWGFLTQENG